MNRWALKLYVESSILQRLTQRPKWEHRNFSFWFLLLFSWNTFLLWIRHLIFLNPSFCNHIYCVWILLETHTREWILFHTRSFRYFARNSKTKHFGSFSCRDTTAKLTESSILILNSVRHFSTFCLYATGQAQSGLRNKHLVSVHLYKKCILEMSDSRNVFNGFMIDKVNFLMNVTENAIDIVTSYMFSPQKWRCNQHVTNNRFYRSTMK